MTGPSSPSGVANRRLLYPYGSMNVTPHHDQAAALRYISLPVLVLHPVIKDEMWLTYPEETEAPVPWYRGRCHEVCEAVQAIANELANGGELDFQAELIHGMFRY